MKKKGVFLAFILTTFVVFLVANSQFSSGQVIVKNESVKGNYFGGDTISGSVLLSLINEPTSARITSNFGGNISLIDFLNQNELNSGVSYRCSTKDCLPDYGLDNVVGSVNIPVGESKLLGFRIPAQDIQQFNSLRFEVFSDAPRSCSKQLMIDVLDRKEAFIQNNKYTQNPCQDNLFGCFNNSLNSEAYLYPEISSTKYCERISVPPAPAYQVGAILSNEQQSTDGIEMEVYKANGPLVGKCSVQNVTTKLPSPSCIVEYSGVNYTDFLVCVYSNSQSLPGKKYKIRAEQAGNNCGAALVTSDNYNVDYEIFARPLEFDVADIEINNSFFMKSNPDLNGIDLTNYVSAYLFDRYEGVCPSMGCIIPLKVDSFTTGQNIGFKNIDLKYTSSIGPLSVNSIYSIRKEDSKINAENITLKIEEANLVIPAESSENRLIIYLDGQTLLSKNINVTPSFGFDIYPKFSLIAANTLFRINSSRAINYSKWEFGDGSSITVNGGNVTHKYERNGNFNVKVELKSKDGLMAMRNFSILVGDPNESASRLIREYQNRISNISKQIYSFPAWISSELLKTTSLVDLNASITKIQNDYSVASDDSAYLGLVERLISLKVPYSIKETETGALPLSLNYDSIETELIRKISNSQDIAEEDLTKGIADWTESNYNASIEYAVISAIDEKGVQTPIATRMKIYVVPKTTSTDISYLVINYPHEAIKTAANYNLKALDSGSYMELSGSSQNIEFILPDKVNIQDIAPYISPETSRLNIASGDIDFIEAKFNWKGFFIWGAILLVAFLVIYIMLQEWYKRNYEKSLFPDSDDLYNIINFIYNSRKAGLTESQIRTSLSRSWAGEKIDYALNKIDGKRTGMYEIPLFKFVENNKVKKEITKRQNGGVDARFIKRPGL